MSGLVVKALLAVSFAARTLPTPESPLEPSLANEVEFAVARGEAWLAERYADATNAPPPDVAMAVRLVGSTNRVSRRDAALRLVSTQSGEGWWLVSSNPAPTRLAVEILKGL